MPEIVREIVASGGMQAMLEDWFPAVKPRINERRLARRGSSSYLAHIWIGINISAFSWMTWPTSTPGDSKSTPGDCH